MGRTLLFALLLAGVQAAAPPDTEIFLAPFSAGADPVGRPVNITNSPGYDNQPSFTPDGAGILFTSIRGGGTQTDIYRYDVASGATAQVTRTPESEYSPTVTPDGSHISVIRVEADGTQRLWRFTLDGGAPELVLAGVKPVGYHAWADDHTLVLFVLGSPASLQLADASAGTAELLVRGINRSIQRIPGGRTISFVARSGAGADATLSIRELDPATKRDHAARERGRRCARSRLRVDAGRHAGDGGERRAVRMAARATAVGSASPISPRSVSTTSRGSPSAPRATASRSSRS